MGWSYVATLPLGLYSLQGLPRGSLFQLVLQTSLFFTVIGVLELIWRRKLLLTGEPRWMKVLVANEVIGTIGLLWNLAWLKAIPVAELVKLITPDIRREFDQMMRSLGMKMTEQLYENSMANAKFATVFGAGSLLFLSQVWIIWRYLRLEREIAAEANLPPILK
jgi:hypothetical protein